VTEWLGNHTPIFCAASKSTAPKATGELLFVMALLCVQVDASAPGGST